MSPPPDDLWVSTKFEWLPGIDSTATVNDNAQTVPVGSTTFYRLTPLVWAWFQRAMQSAEKAAERGELAKAELHEAQEHFRELDDRSRQRFTEEELLTALAKRESLPKVVAGEKLARASHAQGARTAEIEESLADYHWNNPPDWQAAGARLLLPDVPAVLTSTAIIEWPDGRLVAFSQELIAAATEHNRLADERQRAKDTGLAGSRKKEREREPKKVADVQPDLFDRQKITDDASSR